MRKKRIVFTVINDLTYDQRMIRICTSLANHGYEVLLVGRTLKKSIPLQSQPFKQKRLFCFFQKGKFFYLEYNLRLFFFLLWKRFDAVCAIDLDTILPAFYISRWKNKPLIYDAHEYFTEVPEVVRRPKVQRIWEWVAQKTIPKCVYCYTVCQSLADIFQKKYQIPFEVIRNCPVSLQNDFLANSVEYKFDSLEGTSERLEFIFQQLNLLKESDNKMIFYQGALNEGRGLEQMIKAMTQIEGVEFWLAGEGDLSKELRRQVEDLKLADKVKFLGYQLPEDLKKITPKAWLGINLLENKGESYFYSLANKTFDYVQAEVPALHMTFPEYKKLNQEFEVSRLVKSLEVEVIVDAVNELLGNENEYQKLKANCVKAKMIWTWENEEKKLFAFYSKVLP